MDGKGVVGCPDGTWGEPWRHVNKVHRLFPPPGVVKTGLQQCTPLKRAELHAVFVAGGVIWPSMRVDGMMASRGIKTRRRSGGSAGHRTSALLRVIGGARGAAQPRRGLGAPRIFWRRSSSSQVHPRSINRWNRQQHQTRHPTRIELMDPTPLHLFHRPTASHPSRANVCPAHAPCQAHRPVLRSQQLTAQASCPPPE